MVTVPEVAPVIEPEPTPVEAEIDWPKDEPINYDPLSTYEPSAYQPIVPVEPPPFWSTLI